MRKFITTLLLAIAMFAGAAAPAGAAVDIDMREVWDSDTVKVRTGGTLQSNVWRAGGVKSGNSAKWNYKVSAKYVGTPAVKSIRTGWQVRACLNESASLTVGVSKDSFSAGGSSSWQCGDAGGSWTNTLGQKVSDWSATAVVNPGRNYQNHSISVVNVATLHIKGDAKPTTATAAV